LPGAAAARRGGGPRILPKASQALGRFTTSCACDPRAKQSRPGLLADLGNEWLNRQLAQPGN
jgi:hypothetical protein